MSAIGSKQTQLPKGTQPSAGISAGKQASMLLEKGNPGLRRTTPDSEALASSDDETDHGMSLSMTSNPPATRPARRTSWLSEIPSTKRKPSITFGTPISPTNSHPATPPADSWPPATTQNAPNNGSRSHAAQVHYPWGTGIWNEGKKEAPSRLQEVLPSPTATGQMHQSFMSDDASSPIGSRGNTGDATIPFSIPLHPTPKTYRSQSYSVGQLEQEGPGAQPSSVVGPRAVGRGRVAGQYSNLQHRSSRPSVMGDFGHDSGVLGRVREDEVDEDEYPVSASPQPDQQHWDTRVSRLGQIAKENAPLRSADASFRSRTMSSASAASQNFGRASLLYGTGLRETDEVVEDPEDSRDFSMAGQQRTYARRYSEQYSHNGHLPFSPSDDREPEAIRKAHWQTSLGFGSIPEIPQSRRHSFADIPTRHGSISSVNESQNPMLAMSRLSMEDQQASGQMYAEDTLNTSRGDNPSYFSGDATLRAHARSLHQSYAVPHAYGRGQHAALSRHDQPLYVVTFKAQRADVFFIQEDTGLEVKNGDLVIVEADRGTDLGTVAAAGVSWEDARTLKAQLSEEHYKWLMLFSRQGQAGGAGATGTNGLGGSAVGGMGPPGTHGLQEPQSGDLKPKLIKRLAQSHEIQTLREKEGNEAKAKRVCQQKVIEHRLNMEILDAEFQMDWKKLTFYYFADSYINFNSLVTDLFKIYKTRIWMSAINPDSFITPSAGLPLPSPVGMGPGNGAPSHDASERRRQHGVHSQQMPNTFGSDTGDATRNALMTQNVGSRGFTASPYSNLPLGFQHNGRSLYGQSLQQDPFSPYVGNPYASLDQFPGYPLGNTANNRTGRVVQSPGDDWTANFQGLSLGS